MNHTNETRRAGGATGLDKTSFLAGLDNRDIQPKLLPAQAEVFRNPRAVLNARLELLREAIFENLGAVSLFAETAKLSIEAQDDAGMAHAVKMGEHHLLGGRPDREGTCGAGKEAA
jgi:hypothetical protein